MELQSRRDELGTLVFPKESHTAAGCREYPGGRADDIGAADASGTDAVGCADNDLIQRLGDLPDADGQQAPLSKRLASTRSGSRRGPIAAARVSSRFISSSQTRSCSSSCRSRSSSGSAARQRASIWSAAPMLSSR